MASQKSSNTGFEVLYPHDDVNTWIECEVIDVIGGGHSSSATQKFRVRIVPRFSSL